MTNTRGQLDTAAIQMHEVFSAFLRAGFTRDEALQLVKTQMIISSGGEPGE